MLAERPGKKSFGEVDRGGVFRFNGVFVAEAAAENPGRCPSG
jgi:hypothetical protein